MKIKVDQGHSMNLGILVFLLVFSLSGPNVLAMDKKAQQQRLSYEKQRLAERIEESKQREWGVSESLRQMRQNLAIQNAKLTKLRSEIQTTTNIIESTNHRIQSLIHSIAQDKQQIRTKLLGYHYLRRIRGMTLFPGLAGFKHYFRNQRLLQKAAILDIQTIRRLEKSFVEHDKASANLSLRLSELENLESLYAEEKRMFDIELSQQKDYLKSLRQDRALKFKYLKEVKARLKRFDQLVTQLATKDKAPKKSKKYQGFRGMKGKLSAPVKGSLVQEFGEIEDELFRLYKKGVLVKTAPQAEVRGVLAGKVVFSGPYQGFGKMVILDHGKSGLSVYANLDQPLVKMGQEVEQGRILGKVAPFRQSGKPLFFFETRKKQRSVDPLQWLKGEPW